MTDFLKRKMGFQSSTNTDVPKSTVPEIVSNKNGDKFVAGVNDKKIVYTIERKNFDNDDEFNKFLLEQKSKLVNKVESDVVIDDVVVQGSLNDKDKYKLTTENKLINDEQKQILNTDNEKEFVLNERPADYDEATSYFTIDNDGKLLHHKDDTTPGVAVIVDSQPVEGLKSVPIAAGGSKYAQNQLVKNHRKKTQNRRLKKRRYTNKRSNRRK
jgi:hypothetical protein